MKITKRNSSTAKSKTTTLASTTCSQFILFIKIYVTAKNQYAKP